MENIVQNITQPKWRKTKNEVTKICDDLGINYDKISNCLLIFSKFRHPVLSKDDILNGFIRDGNVKEELSKTQPKSKGSNNIIAWRNKICKNENDDWFMIRHEELKALHQEMSQTLESFKAVTKT